MRASSSLLCIGATLCDVNDGRDFHEILCRACPMGLSYSFSLFALSFARREFFSSMVEIAAKRVTRTTVLMRPT